MEEEEESNPLGRWRSLFLSNDVEDDADIEVRSGLTVAVAVAVTNNGLLVFGSGARSGGGFFKEQR